MSDEAADQPVWMPLEHRRNCPATSFSFPMGDEGDCTCGLHWRIQLQTEREMHNAWRKRAEQAEREMVPMRSALEFIVQQENLTFAECSLAEEIVSRAKAAAQSVQPAPAGAGFDDWWTSSQFEFGESSKSIAYRAWSAALAIPSAAQEEK